MAVTKHNVDFTNVKEGGFFSKKRMPEGEYLAKITKVEDAPIKESAEDKSPMWVFTIQLKGMSSATYPYYCKLSASQLWKVRNLLVAAGINVPKKQVSVDPSKLVGKMIGVVLSDTDYNGKDQSEVDAVISANEIEGDGADVSDDDVDEPDVEPDIDEDEDEAEEETPAPVAKKKKKAPVPEPEEDDEDDEPEPPKKKKKSKPAKAEADDEIDIEDLD